VKEKKMKLNFIIMLFSILLLTSCSSTYRITDFPSTVKFYEDFNSKFKGKDAKIVLTNDSVLLAVDSLNVKDEVITAKIIVVDRINREILLSKVDQINYDGTDNHSAKIYLKDGEKLRAENISLHHDTINFIEVNDLVKSYSNHIDNVKSVTYSNRWKGIFSGGKIGLFSGVLLGYLTGKASLPRQPDKNQLKSDEHDEGQEIFYPLFGAVAGFISGGFVGYFLGSSVTYEFNP